MDTITQAALGAAIAVAGWRDLGLRGVFFGVACGLLPDADIVLGWGDDAEWDRLLTHRGSSHSMLVLPWVALPVGALAHWRWGGERLRWMHLAFWGLVTHPLLDVCTTYGTQLLAPLSRTRFSIDAVSILDPVVTLPLLAGVFLRKRTATIARAALAWMALYIGVGFGVTQIAKDQVRDQLANEGFEPVALRTSVPLLFAPLRRVSARNGEGELRVGMHAFWAPERTVLVPLPGTEGYEEILATPRGERFHWFADGYLSPKVDGDTTYLLDMRFGLFSDPTWTPFSARIEDDQLELVQRRGGIDRDAEWEAAKRLLLGP